MITNSILSISVVVLIISSLFIPVEIPYSFNSTAIVYPKSKWELIKNNDGTLVSTLHNFQTGAIQDYNLFQFDRGDIINISFNDIQNDRNYIEVNSCIANINSNILSERLIQLENQISIENANLARGKSGQKSQIISQSREELRLTNQEKDLRLKNLNRVNKLYPEGLVSEADLEEAQSLYDKSVTEVKVARKELTVKRSGDKPEEINYIFTQIEALDKEIEFLKEKIGNYAIHTPINGKVSYEANMNYDKIIVEDVDEYILYIPVKLKDRSYLTLKDKVIVNVIGVEESFEASLIEIGEKVQVIDRNFVVIAKALLKGKTAGITSGMPVKCVLIGGQVSPIQYISRSTRESI